MGKVEKCVSAVWPRGNGRVSCDRFAGGERDEGPQFRTEAALQVRLTGDKLQPVGKVESNQYAEAIRSV
jgi:hypothetical protein